MESLGWCANSGGEPPAWALDGIDAEIMSWMLDLGMYRDTGSGPTALTYAEINEYGRACGVYFGGLAVVFRRLSLCWCHGWQRAEKGKNSAPPWQSVPGHLDDQIAAWAASIPYTEIPDSG